MKRALVYTSVLVLLGWSLFVITREDAPEKVVAEPGLLDSKATCERLEGVVLLGGKFCTHGHDPEAGFTVQGDTSNAFCLPVFKRFCLNSPVIPTPSPTPSPEPSPRPGCGSDVINRIQAIYLRESGDPDKFEERKSIFAGAAAEADNLLMKSAERESREAHLRFVTDTQCRLDIKKVVTDQTLDSFGAMISAVANAGHSQQDYLYLIFADKDLGCGIGTVRGDNQPDPTQNTNNNGTGYSGIFPGCTNGHTVLHELGHNMGAVQKDAPNSDGTWHCTDEHDIMCYGANMRYICDGELMDCGRNDYFAFEPQGDYLKDHWNLTKSRWMDVK